jgi:hypothetical protein
MNLLQDCLTPWSVLANLASGHHACVELYQSSIPTDASSFTEYLRVYLMTFILEWPWYFLFLRFYQSGLRILITNFVLNIATHPIVYLVLPQIFSRFDQTYIRYLIIAEIFAPTVEALILRYTFKIPWKTAIVSSLFANLFSWTVGVYWNS